MRAYKQFGTYTDKPTHSLVKVPLNSGGYTKAGHYFGAVFGHVPIGYLYRVENLETGKVDHLRAWSRIGARTELFKLYPDAAVQGNRS